MTTVLVIDDNDVDREQIRRLLGGQHDLIEAATAREGLALVSSASVDCVLLDYRLPDEDGVRVLDLLAGRFLPIVMLTSQGSEQVAVAALKHGAVDYLLKSDLTRDRLQKVIEVAIEQSRLRQELDLNQRALELAVGQMREQRNELAAAHRALQLREEHLRFVLAQLPVLHWTTDTALALNHVGGMALDALGVSPREYVGKPARALFGDSEAEEMAAIHAGALEGTSGVQVATRSGRTYQCHVGALRDAGSSIVGTVGLALDVTAARETEQQLRHVVKMDALGQLAGGVAHDFNNLLSVILGFAGFIKEALPPQGNLRDDLDQVIGAAERAAVLVRQLLTFSRVSTSTPRVVSAADVIGETLPMLRRLVGEDIELALAIAPDPWRVRIDPHALEQVVVNLTVNARDAMSRGGRIEIEIQHVSLTEDLVHSRDHHLSTGDYLVLCVTDEGEGILRDVIERIFDPFFTTKEVGRGTGLGLSTVYGIARQAGGTVTVDSDFGHGSSFRVYLPRALDAEESTLPSPVPVPSGTETVLLVEDEEPVRAVAARALRRLGYSVIEASDGASALTLCRETPTEIDLVLTDVVMPGLAGPEVAQALVEMRPTLRVLYMSGYTNRAARERGRLPPDAKLIEKPLTLDRLGRAVRDALDSAAVPQGSSTTRQ